MSLVVSIITDSEMALKTKCVLQLLVSISSISDVVRSWAIDLFMCQKRGVFVPLDDSTRIADDLRTSHTFTVLGGVREVSWWRTLKTLEV